MTKRKFPTQFKRGPDDKQNIAQLFEIVSALTDNVAELLNNGMAFGDNANGTFARQIIPPNVKTRILSAQKDPVGAILIGTNGLILPGYAISVENGFVVFQHSYPTAVNITLYIMGK